MGMLGTALYVLAGIAMLIFSIQILIVAFQKSLIWGLASLFIPFVILVFVIMNWQETKTPFLRSLVAFAVSLVGMGLTVYAR